MIFFRSTVLAGIAVLGIVIAPEGLFAQPKAKLTLDYEFYKARVEPIFLKKKAGHTRCVVCHSESNNFLKFEPLSSGASGCWRRRLVAGSPAFTSSEAISKFLRDCSSFQVLAPGDSRSSRKPLLLSAWQT